jgi:hypothetical protein
MPSNCIIRRIVAASSFSVALANMLKLPTAIVFVVSSLYAVVAILMLAAVATPPDVVSQVVLFTVVYGLYEISIQLVRRIEHVELETFPEFFHCFTDGAQFVPFQNRITEAII